MDLEARLPPIAPHLINTDLRLPSSFRTLCAQTSYTNEEIGRIARCLALGTTELSTPRIAPDIEVFGRILNRRAATKERVKRLRARKAAQGAGSVDDESVGKRKPGRKPSKPLPAVVLAIKAPLPDRTAAVPPTPPDVKSGQNVSVDPVAPVAQATPVAQPAFIEKVIAAHHQSPKTRAIRKADKLSYDLFALMSEPDAPKPPAPAAPVSPTIEVVHPSVDSRNDSAWITVKFAMFWKQYPRKVAKGDAVKAFTKLIKKQVDVEAFMRTTLASLEWWKQQPGWTKDNGKFIPYPASWLNGGHWEDIVDNKDAQDQGKAEFLRGDAESDDDLLRRMQGG
jgi:hypothetical protein